MKKGLKNQAFFMWFNRLLFPWFYLGHWGKETALVKGGHDTRFRVRVNTSDILLIWEIWKFKIYADPKFPIRPGDIVLDIGAHIGVFSVWAARQAHQGKIYAYEACRSNHELLVNNKALNNIRNLHIENLAVNDRSGEFAFFQPGKNGALGSLLQDTSAHQETVTATTLADIFEEQNLQHIDYLKMDVEGAEYSIIMNTPPELLKSIRYIVLEYHRLPNLECQPEDLAAFLRSQGFIVSLEPGLFLQERLFGTGVIKAWRLNADIV